MTKQTHFSVTARSRSDSEWSVASLMRCGMRNPTMYINAFPEMSGFSLHGVPLRTRPTGVVRFDVTGQLAGQSCQPAPAVVEDHLTLGATWTMESKAELSAYFMHAFENEVKGDSPSNASDAGHGDLKMSQQALGVAYGWNF